MTDSYAVNKLRSRQRQIPLQEEGAFCISVIAGSNGAMQPCIQNCSHKINSLHLLPGGLNMVNSLFFEKTPLLANFVKNFL